LTAIATDNAGASTTSAPVSVTVNANKPPSVSLTAPTTGATYVAPANVTVSASATDSDGTVKNVSFYAGAQLIGSVSAIPYSVAWSNVAAGSYTLTAVATDNTGASTTSAPVTMTVNKPNQPPTVALTAPTNGATFVAPAMIALGAAASDSDGTVTNLSFYA